MSHYSKAAGGQDHVNSFGNGLAGDFEPPIISAISSNGSSLMDCFFHEPVGQCFDENYDTSITEPFAAVHNNMGFKNGAGLEDFLLWEVIMQGRKDCPISRISM
ncbi:hypothetical protein ACE6H2_010296 [Prunus campanulata]